MTTFADIVAAIGEPAARKLVEHFGGQRIWVPTTRRFKLRQRDRRIIMALNEHYSYAEVAKQFGLSERQVKRIGNGT